MLFVAAPPVRNRNNRVNAKRSHYVHTNTASLTLIVHRRNIR